MHKLVAILTAGFVVLLAGCQTAQRDARIFHPWGCEDLSEAKARFNSYQHVFVVCIFEDHWEDRGPNRYSLHHSKGTVVHVYKGDWRTSERIAFVQWLDYRAPTNATSIAGSLGFVFTSQHADTEIGLDTGELVYYSPEYASALDLVFPR